MRAPDFWFRPLEAPGLAAKALAPLGWLTAALTARRVARGPGLRPGIPVICVGNINVGGTGKTPVAIALAERLAARGVSVHFLSRGHGGSERGPLLVDPRRHGAADVGDESLLLAAFAPAWVARDRAAGALAAAEAGAGAIVMDDGHQNPALAKDLSLVIADAGRGFGNGRCLPAGPLREPVRAGLARADMLISLGEPQAQAAFAAANLAHLAGGPPHLPGRLVALPTGMDWQGARLLAFAGIGDPGKFFATLRGLGADLVRALPFDDHQPYAPALLARIEAEAAALDAQLVTTEKDVVRLPPGFRPKVLTLPVRLQLDDWAPLDRALDQVGL